MGSNGWSLEVVRGRETGRVYALGRGETVLGNALDGAPGVDLALHEADSPRRMAARQAQLDLSAQGLTVRDLESPGGTFVNRQRLLPGQARALQPGDLIQLAGVQLKVVQAASPAPVPPAAKNAPHPAPSAAPSRAAPPRPAAPAPAQAGPLAAVFTLASGARCRSWDDFLTVSAQRWPAMRDELVSGRLAAFLVSIGRGEIAPSAQAPGSPDERLDAWLGTLPTTRPSRPELDVHPAVLKLRAAPGGGMIRATLQIANTGYRLLRSSVRVEPASAGWVKITGEAARGPVVTVDQTDLTLEIHVPETFDTPPRATIVLDSNGGTRRVEVQLERPVATEVIPEGTAAVDSHVGLNLGALIARQPIGWRLVTWSVGALLLRLLLQASGLLLGAGAGAAQAGLPIQGAAILFAVLGCVVALQFALKHGELPDVPAVAFAGAFAGVLAAAVVVAACRTIEPILGPLATSPIAACLLWGLLGLGLAGLSAELVPASTGSEGSS
jgi:hypothetical protein